MLVFCRSAIFSLGYFLATVGYGSLSLLLIPLPVRLRHKIIISWTAVIIALARVVCGVRYRVLGREHLPHMRWPLVILSKHQSTWETLYLQRLFWPASTVLKQELLRIPFFGWGLRGLVPIAIDRANPREALMQVRQMGIRRLQQGYNLLLFPEGTRTAPGERGRYARSGADIALEAGVDVVPVAVSAGRCWPAHSFRKYPGLITLAIGPPIAVAGKTSRQIMAEVETWIESTMAEIDSDATQSPVTA